MRAFIVYLTAFLATTAVRGEIPKEPATTAKVIFTGSGSGFFQVGSEVDSETFIVIHPDEKTCLVVRTPKTFSLDNSFKILAAEGTLTSTEDDSLVKLANSKAKRVPLLVAEKVTVVDEKNKERLPADGRGQIEGIAGKVKLKVGSELVEWAILNSVRPIPLIFPKDVKPPEPDSPVRVSGRIRAIEGELLLEVEKTEPAKN